MRRMINEDNGTVLKVIKHIILRNFWEYYILADESDTPDKDIAFALVMGDATELGSVYLPEIEPYVISRTAELSNGVAPATGYRWADGYDDEPA